MGLYSRNTLSIGLMPFGEAQSKAMRAYAQSGQYHTIVESCVHLTVWTSFGNHLDFDFWFLKIRLVNTTSNYFHIYRFLCFIIYIPDLPQAQRH